MRPTSVVRHLVTIYAGLLTGLVLPAFAQKSDVPPAFVFSHLAGPPGGHGNADGTGPTARFGNPTGLAIDSAGNIFVADYSAGNVRRITPAGIVTTVLTAGDAAKTLALGSWGPLTFCGIAIDNLDNLLISDISVGLVLKFSHEGILSIYTGQVGPKIFPSTDGTLAQASFWDPSGMAFDAPGNLYVTDPTNDIVRKISPAGQVSTFAGTPPAYRHPQGSGVDGRKAFPGSADGLALSAQLFGPSAVAADAGGNVYIADTQNNTIRQVAPNGQVTTLAGKAREEGSADGTGDSARFRRPHGVAADAAGNVYVADTDNATIRKITPAGVVTTLAGSPGDRRAVDGPGATARFVAPNGLSFDRKGNRLLVGDGFSFSYPLDQSGTIRQVSLDGVVTTLAGLAGAAGSTDGKGDAARFKKPADVAVDTAGNVFVADDLNHTIRRIAPDGTTTTIAGRPGIAGHVDGPGNQASFNRPVSLALDGAGYLIVADHDNHLIRKVAPDGTTTTLAGQAGVAGAQDGTGPAASFHNPVSVAVDGAGNIYVGDGDYFPGSGDPARQFGTIRKITPTGEVSTLAGTPVIVQYEQAKFNWDGVGADARFGDPTGLTADADGTLYVADYAYGRIRKVTPQGAVTTLQVVDERGADVTFRARVGITRDNSGNLYVTDTTYAFLARTQDATINRISPAGVQSVVGGTATVIGSHDGVGGSAQFNNATGIEIGANGTLYIADTDNNAIRKGAIGSAPVISTQPLSQTAATGGGVQFSVTATGNPAPTYQWLFNGSPFQGATASTLSFANVRATDAGDYTVVVTNAVGSVTSAKATLTVTAASIPQSPAPAGGGGGAPSIWFLLTLGTLRLLRRLGVRLRWRDRRRA